MNDEKKTALDFNESQTLEICYWFAVIYKEQKSNSNNKLCNFVVLKPVTTLANLIVS